MLHTDCWRPGDIICEMPSFELDELNINSFDWFNTNQISDKHCLLILSQLHLKLKFSRTGKTDADLMLLVIPEMVKPLSHAIIISEIHRKKVNQWELPEKKSLLGTFWTGDSPETIVYMTSIRAYHLKFFDKYPELGEQFSPSKFNNSTMTYLYCHSVEAGDVDTTMAIDYSKQARSHDDVNTSAGYIKLSNKDGTIDRVSINLFKRGHFGWQYNFMVNHVSKKLSIPQTLEERTKTIVDLSREFKPSELEEWASALMQINNQQTTTVQRIMKLDKNSLQQLIIKIYTGKMPSKDSCGQCLINPDCIFPQKTKCIGCPEFIPQFQVLREASNEFHRLILSLTTARNEANFRRDSRFLLNVLLLLDEALKAFGSGVVEAYLPLSARKSALRSISSKLRIKNT
jgi:hypothetical protein